MHRAASDVRRETRVSRAVWTAAACSGRELYRTGERAHCALERDGSGMSDTVFRAGAGAVLQIRRGAVSCIVGSEMGKGPRCGIDPSAAGIPQSGVPAGCGTAGRMVSV